MSFLFVERCLATRTRGEENAYTKTKQGCQENMNAMAYGSIGKLYQIMLDYPGPVVDSVRGQWRAFEEMKKEGLVDTVGRVQLQCEAARCDPYHGGRCNETGG